MALVGMSEAVEQPAIIYKGKKPYKMIGVYLMGDVRCRQRTLAAADAGCTRAPDIRLRHHASSLLCAWSPPVDAPDTCAGVP
jgi:hypothetical protein